MHADDTRAHTQQRLRDADGVLVWVNPITAGRDRAILDRILRDVASGGVWVSAHPDVIDVIGTKEVLYRTRTIGWGTDVQLYGDTATLRTAFPARLSTPRVLKRARGNEGLGVWKIESVDPRMRPSLTNLVRVEQGHDGTTEQLALEAFLERFADYLAGGGRLVEQPYLPRVAEGMLIAPPRN